MTNAGLNLASVLAILLGGWVSWSLRARTITDVKHFQNVFIGNMIPGHFLLVVEKDLLSTLCNDQETPIL